MLVTVEQAAANALGRWLATNLPDVDVDTRWPDTTELPARALTILLAGPPDEEPLDPIVVGEAALDGTRGLFTWRMAALRQPMQLDLWTRYHTERDDLLARLVPLLHAGMGASIGAYNASPTRHGVLVRLADGWEGYADCLFQRPSHFDTPDAVQRCEYRATYRGFADVDLTITAESARLAALHIRQRIMDARGTTTETTTVTRSRVANES